MKRPADDTGGDVLNSVGLLLNLGAVISLALWLSVAGDGGSSLLTLGVGTLTVALFAASMACFCQ